MYSENCFRLLTATFSYCIHKPKPSKLVVRNFFLLKASNSRIRLPLYLFRTTRKNIIYLIHESDLRKFGAARWKVFNARINTLSHQRAVEGPRGTLRPCPGPLGASEANAVDQ